jgi:hypothetical protein
MQHVQYNKLWDEKGLNEVRCMSFYFSRALDDMLRWTNEIHDHHGLMVVFRVPRLFEINFQTDRNVLTILFLKL